MGALRIGKMEGNSVILPWHNSGTIMYRVKPVKSNLLLLCSKHSKMYTNSIGVLSNMNRGGGYFLGVHNEFPRMSSYYGSEIKTLINRAFKMPTIFGSWRRPWAIAGNL